MSIKLGKKRNMRGSKRLGPRIQDGNPKKMAKLGKSPFVHPISPIHSPGRKSNRSSRKANVQVKVSEKLRQMILRFLENARRIDDGVDLSLFRQKFELFHNVSFDTTKLGVSPRDASLSLILKSIKGVMLVSKPNRQSNPWVYRVPSYWSHFGNERIEGVVEDYSPDQGVGIIKVKHDEYSLSGPLDRSVDRIFLHYTNLHILGGYREIDIGEEVECGVGKTPEGYITAVAVTKKGEVCSLNKDRYLKVHRVAKHSREEDPCLQNGFTIKVPRQKLRGLDIRTCQEGPPWVQQLMSKNEQTSIEGARALLSVLLTADPSNRRLEDPCEGPKRDAQPQNITRPVPYDAEFARIVFQTSPWILKPLINLLQHKSVASMILDIVTRLVVPFTGEPPFINPALIAIPSTVAILSKLLTRNMDRVMYTKVLRVIKTVCIISLECRQKSRVTVVDYIANRSQSTVSAIEIHESLDVLKYIFASTTSEEQLPTRLGALELNIFCRVLKHMQHFLTMKKPEILGNVLHILTSLCYLWRPGMPIISIALQPSAYKVLTSVIKNPPKSSKFDIAALGIDLLSALLIPQASDTNSSNIKAGAFAVIKTLLLDGESPQNRATACNVVEKALSWKRDEAVLNVIKALLKSRIFHMLQGFAILDRESIVSGGAQKALEALLKRLPVGNQIREQVQGMKIPFKPGELKKSTVTGKDVVGDPTPLGTSGIPPDFPIYNKPIVTLGGLVDAAEEDELDYIDEDQVRVSARRGMLQNGRLSSSQLGKYHISQAILLVGDLHMKFSQALSSVLHPPNQDNVTGKKHPSSRIISTSWQSATELISNDAEIICKLWPLRDRLAGVILDVRYGNVTERLVEAASSTPTRLRGMHHSTPLRSFLHPVQPCFHRVLLPFPSARDLKDLDMLNIFFQGVRSLLRKDAEVHVHVGVNPKECFEPVIPTNFPSIGTEDLTERTQILQMAARNAGYRVLSRFPFIPCPGYDLSKVPNASYEPTTYAFLPE